MSRPPISTPVPPSQGVVDEMQGVLQRLAGRPYSRSETQEAIYNLGRFFSVLERWAQEDAVEDLGSPTGSHGDVHPPESRVTS